MRKLAMIILVALFCGVVVIKSIDMAKSAKANIDKRSATIAEIINYNK